MSHNKLGRQISFDINPHRASIHKHNPEQRFLAKELNHLRRIYGDNKEKRNFFNRSFHFTRFIIVAFGGLAVGLMSLLRLNVTVAILNMVNRTQLYLEEHPVDADLASYFGESYLEVGEFDWNNEIQQLIISYYMIAYTLPQLFTTKLAIKIGMKYSIPLCLALCALSCLLTPTFAYYGWQYVTLLRIINGLGASAILPMMVNLIEIWLQRDESSSGLSILLFMQSILFTTSPLISAYLAAIHWKWTFYVPAYVTLIFCLLWLLLISDEPDKCWFISEKELELISNNNTNTLSNVNLCKTEKKVSWTRALRLKSFYALVAVWIFYCSSFGSFTFLIPSYMEQILNIPILDNGILCFLMQSGCVMSALWPQPILYQLQNRLNMSVTNSRRLVISIICSLTIITWSLVALYHRDQVILFSINRVFHLSTDTIVTSTIMSQYCNTGVGSEIFSVINAIGNLSTVFFCTAVGYFLDQSGQSAECWSWVFVSMSMMSIGTILLYSTIITSNPVELDNDVTGNEKAKKEQYI